jgi:hypothetical protein
MFNGDRFNFTRPYANPEGPVGPVTNRGLYGERDVRFNDDGRPLFPGNERQPTNMLLWRNNNGGRPPQDQAQPDNWRYRPWSSSQDVSQQRAPIITRRFDVGRELPYVTTGMPLPDPIGGSSAAVGVTRQVRTTMKPETIVIEEMKIYDQKPCAWWLFIIAGVIMFILGILNVVWCWEYDYYCRFWTAIFLVLVGIIGAVHKGDYIVKWKSWLYIVLGVITTAAVMVSSFFLLRSFIHQLIEIGQFGAVEYLATQEQRYALLAESPRVNLSSWDQNIWVCFALDAVDIALLIIGFIVLSSTLLVIDRFYNSHLVITKKVEPFCEPWLFNPWGQSSLGQAMLFIGFVLNGIGHGTLNDASYAGIWCGVVPLFAGVAAALSLKSCGVKHRILNIIATVLELGSIVVSIVAIILLVIGIADNVQTLVNGAVMIKTTFPQVMMVISSFTFALATLACVVNVFYSLSLLIRILYCFCTNCCGKDLTKAAAQKDEMVEETKYLDGGQTSKNNQEMKMRTEEISYPYGRPFIRRANIPGFDPYQPAGSRPFYMQ